MSKPDLTIRDEQPSDYQAIASLTRAAFANVDHSDHMEQWIIEGLRQAGQLSISLVASASGQPIGHIALSPVELSDGSPNWYGLGPVSVLPEWQGQGVGSRLIEIALQRLRSLGARGCVLLGDPNYYARFGFRSHPQLWLADVPAEFFQALVWEGQVPHAQVSYHQAFYPGNAD